MKLNITQQEPESLDLTPLIDIIFQLVLFFMIASSFVEDHGFNIELPRVQQPELIASEQAITLLLPREGGIGLYPGQPVYPDSNRLLAELQAFATAQSNAGKPAVVVIKADRSVTYERVIQAWNLARRAGILNISFQVQVEHASSGSGSP